MANKFLLLVDGTSFLRTTDSGKIILKFIAPVAQDFLKVKILLPKPAKPVKIRITEFR